MQYREFGKTGEKLSVLGFGAMRLPTIGADETNIDETASIEMIRYSIDNGVNYLDTAYPYHGGNSETFCAKVMADGYRDKVKIATKLPSWDIKTHADMERILDEQRGKLGVDTIDFYLLHALNKTFWQTMKDNGYQSFLNEAKRDGKITYAGFSFHGDIGLFKEIVDDYDWDFCQIQFNYLDVHYQAGLSGMRYAASKGLGVIVMEPLRGGMLSRNDMPKEVQAIWNLSDINRTSAEWALRYVWDFPEVGLVLSGMGTLEQVEENIKTACEALPNSLTSKEKELIKKVGEFYRQKTIVDCTNCRYCMPCPVGVDIPENFWAYNHHSLFDDFEKAKFLTTNMLNKEQQAKSCIECGECEAHCPQNIEIRKHLKIIAQKYKD